MRVIKDDGGNVAGFADMSDFLCTRYSRSIQFSSKSPFSIYQCVETHERSCKVGNFCSGAAVDPGRPYVSTALQSRFLARSYAKRGSIEAESAAYVRRLNCDGLDIKSLENAIAYGTQ